METAFFSFLVFEFLVLGLAYSIRPNTKPSHCHLELKKLEICKRIYPIDLPNFTDETDLDEAVQTLNGFSDCVGNDTQCTVTKLNLKLLRAQFFIASRRADMYQCYSSPFFEQLKKSCPGRCSEADHWNCVIDGLKDAKACSDGYIGILYDDVEFGFLTDPCEIKEELEYEMKVHYGT
ncbi:hypothetical protein L5515_010276 [Caenorhabditis briggsae]|uniref:Uncharacterized protein n=1 Tax=Caenorhabditis briggsae TaxID=6238 RepID=A0AAE9JCZ4_CAEBR|nr:hypothetical protein L5515_010276 [Caenorhabditis briggsae]